MRALRNVLALSLLLAAAKPLTAQEQPRQHGPVIQSAGAVFPVPDPDFETPLDHTYRIVYEVAETGEAPDRLNRQLNTVARFLNMHVRAGVPLEQLHVAVVVHGAAGKDLLTNAAYRERYGVDNPNATLVEELGRAGVRIILCGQTAAFRELPREHLAEPVEVALSAMTALNVLQDRGYHLNPF